MRNLFLGLLISAAAVPAFAQTAAGPDDALAAARNQLGILEYCQANGHIDDTAAATQAKILAMMPAPTDTAKVEAAYEKGKAGTVSALGTEQNLADAAKAQGSDEAALCTQLAAMLAQAAAQLPK